MRTIPILLLRAVIDLFRSRESLEAERLALHQELANLKKLGQIRPQLRVSDRVFWVVLSQLWTNWRDALVTVQPETVQRWRRSGLRLIWPKRARRQSVGRPRTAKENQRLIRWMSRDNALWGAPRVHGELLKLGIDLSQTTVAKYILRRPERPFQTWRTFLRNHARELIRTGSVNTSKISDFRLLYHQVRFAVQKMIDRILCGSFGEHSGGQEQVALLNDKPLRALPRRISIRQRMCFRSRGPPPLRTPLIKHAIRVALGAKRCATCFSVNCSHQSEPCSPVSETFTYVASGFSKNFR